MSYDLGYEYGYESDWEKVPAGETLSTSPENSSLVYRMGPSAPGAPGGADRLQAYQEMLRSLGLPLPAGTESPPAPPGAAGVGGTDSPPPGSPGADAHDGLTGMGAVPPNPGDAPNAAPEGTPTMTHAELVRAHGGEAWTGVRTELRDHYGFNDAEVDAFENQYRNMTPDQLRSGEPPILPAHPDDSTAMSGLTTDAARRPRIEVANAIRRRVADEMVHDTGGRIHGMFAEGEISRDTADAMAAQMYRNADPAADPDANPVRIDLMRAASTRSGSEPSRIDRDLTALRGSSRAPNPRDPSAGLHRTDPQVAPLFRETEGHYTTRATTALDSAFRDVPGRGNYYTNSAAHRSADAQAYLAHRGIDHDPGALRGISRTTRPPAAPGAAAGTRPPHPSQGEVNSFVSAYRETGTNRLTAMGSTLDQRRAAERPVDTSTLSTADRSGLARDRIGRAEAEEVADRARASDLANQITVADHNEEIASRGRVEQAVISAADRIQQHEMSMEQQHDQQLNQLMQSMANQGMQLMQSQIQMLNNLTTEQLRSINQTTTNLLQQGAPRPFDIVAQMLSGGAPRR